VVSSLFSIKAAHWRDAIRATELGARGKERTARWRVIRVKGSASRGDEGSSTSMSMSTRKNAEARFALSVNCYRPRKRLRLTRRRGIGHEHEHEWNPGRGCLRSGVK
jgi:hypothetical protein